MTFYNMSFIDRATGGPLDLFTGVNDASGFWLLGASLIFLFMLLFISFRKQGTLDAFLGASFIVAVAAGAAFGAGLLPAWHLVVPVTLLVISLIIKVWGDG